MDIEPGQVEAFAARGYSLVDIARLLGVDKGIFHDQRSDSQELADAHNRGFQRWKDVGEPDHAPVKVLIQDQVYALLQQREMSRPQLRDELGFKYDEINLAIESLEAGLMIQREDDVSTSWYRAHGVASPVAEKRKSAAVSIVPVPQAVTPPGNNGHSELKKIDSEPCIDCGGPKSYGAGKRCKTCYDTKAAANKEQKISAKSPEIPRNFEVLNTQQEHSEIVVPAEIRGKAT